MIINITGSTKARRDLVKKSVDFVVKELGLTRMKTLNVNIKLVKMEEGNYGLCSADDPGKHMRNFTITVNKNMNISMLIRTVLHEFVHVKQFARSELNAKYIGMQWKTAHVTDDTDYMDLPWEKEAYRLEEKLAAKIWKENIL